MLQPDSNSSLLIPDLSAAAFVAADAIVVGDVMLAEQTSIWYGAVVRADVNAIHVGRCSNIQDGAILHGDPGPALEIDDYVTIGHRATIHGLAIGRGSLIGIGAIILEGVKVGVGSIVGAGAVVTKNVPDGVVVAGIPAKVRRELSEPEIADLITHAEKYYKLAQVHAGTGTDKGFY
ncbi:hexapeptide repeat-containing transferase [Thalassoporum mexicanum PCC 7367]|uniref:gamma carbonic anhydrase family protein n=1 Tax=Thalassoporum mexicanum TaxID=3457544 RepID=UPI00029FBF8E|nr:gamma carbonic anhydrase family protein [Pseudanabaena sp. PCC 7367]AFY69636.1 hexapeptide repeat-containing transferase [Pseudanabaena sp. PCC 7367]